MWIETDEELLKIIETQTAFYENTLEKIEITWAPNEKAYDLCLEFITTVSTKQNKEISDLAERFGKNFTIGTFPYDFDNDDIAMKNLKEEGKRIYYQFRNNFQS